MNTKSAQEVVALLNTALDNLDEAMTMLYAAVDFDNAEALEVLYNRLNERRRILRKEIVHD